MPTAVAEKGTLHKAFDRGIERWTQSTLLIDTLFRREINSSCFTQPVANYIESRLDKTADKWRIPTKAQVLLPPNHSDP